MVVPPAKNSKIFNALVIPLPLSRLADLAGFSCTDKKKPAPHLTSHTRNPQSIA
jgi:hypothetical protein